MTVGECERRVERGGEGGGQSEEEEGMDPFSFVTASLSHVLKKIKLNKKSRDDESRVS